LCFDVLNSTRLFADYNPILPEICANHENNQKMLDLNVISSRLHYVF
jgi:hypothetical protein